MIAKIAEGSLHTKYGKYKEYLYYNGQKESIAMIHGELTQNEAVICRIHSSCIFGHYFNSIECTCQSELDKSQKLIQEMGQGIIILLDQEGKGNGHFALLNSTNFKRQGFDQSKAYEKAGFPKDNRNYMAAADILKDLGIKSIKLLGSNPKKAAEIKNQGIDVVELISLS